MPDRYNSPVSLCIHPFDSPDTWERFSDFQMAYIRMEEIIAGHPNEWDVRPLHELADRLDQKILEEGLDGAYVCVSCDDLQLCLYYTESL